MKWNDNPEEKVIANIFPETEWIVVNPPRIPDGPRLQRVSLELSRNTDFTWDQMRRLSEYLGTTNINFSYEFEKDYSDLTPGAGAELIIICAPIGENAERYVS